VFDQVFGLVRSFVDGGDAAPSQTSTRAVERLAQMRSFLKRLDTELPQVIVEALEEAARIIGADVAAIYEVQLGVMQCAFSTDPTLLETRIEMGDEQEIHEKGTTLLRNAASVADALCAMLYAGDREWVLLLGERNGRINRDIFEADAETLLDVFTQLLRQLWHVGDPGARVDHVTGLPDRWATMNRLTETISAAKRNGTHAALLFIDLNGFKGVNDSFGHAHGDSVLKLIAMTLREALRANEFVGRIGGDEFAVILPVVRSSEEACAAATRLAEAVRDLEVVHGGGPVSLSVGVAFYPEHAASVEDWLHHADLAMYQAKRQHESYCIFNPSDSPEVWTPLAIEVEEAFTREFLLCFQPIFEVESGKVVAAEALLRSLHPQDGVQSAYITMEAARARRSIAHLDAWVTRRALASASAWRLQGVQRIHVNIGQASDAILGNVLRAVDAGGCDTSMLALELEWSKFIADFEPYHGFAEAAERCGLYVGLDGFGETELDLPLLESLSVRFVKPSRALLPSGGARGKALDAIVALSRVYNWEVIATRVATSGDRAACRNTGVKYMQGFAVAQPMTAIDFNQWIETSPRIALVV
jgi:diguanylate cyclase (GGDEF)-like protein